MRAPAWAWLCALSFGVANPTLRFHFVPRGPGELNAEVEDSKEGRYRGRLLVD